MTIKCILFDNNGVLTTNHHENVNADLAKAAGVPKQKIHEAILMHCVPLDKGLISDVEFSRRVLRTVHSSFSPEKLTQIRLRSYHPKKAVMRFAKQLAKKHNIGLLSNFGREFAVSNKIWKLEKIFPRKNMFLSYKLHMCKPNKNIFQAVLKRLKLRPSEIVFIDDSKENIATARSLEIHAIHFTTLAKLKKDLKKYGI